MSIKEVSLFYEITNTGPSHGGGGGEGRCPLTTSDTMAPAGRLPKLPLHRRPTVTTPSTGVKHSVRSRVGGRGDDVTVAAGGWLGEAAGGLSRGSQPHTLGLLFSICSHWAPAGEQSCL